MKENLYYTIDVTFYDDDLVMGPTGHKTITIYRINPAMALNEMLNTLAIFIIELDQISEYEIREWLTDNNYDEQQFDLEQL